MKNRKNRVWRTLALLAVTLFVLLVASRCHDARVAAAMPKPAVTVLMYHHILPQAQAGRFAGNSIVTYAEAFEKQLDFLCDNGYTTVTPAQVEAFYVDGTPLPEKAVLITFDDGYLSNATVAYPLLKKRGMKATVFLVTGHLGDVGQTFSPRLVQMTDRETIKNTADVFTYACHTNDLHTLCGGASALCTASDEARAADLKQCRAAIAKIPNACTTAFAYPYGAYNDAVKASVKASGIHIAFRASEGVATADSDPLALPRYPVDTSVSFSRFCHYFGENG